MYKNLLNVLFPELCCVCQSPLLFHEHLICIDCRLDLAPLKTTVDHCTIVSDFFYGRIHFTCSFAMFSFHKRGNNQQLIHSLKYRNKPDLGVLLGKWFIHTIPHSSLIYTVDMIIGVPIHKKRLQQRGYNQINTFGKTIANTLNIPYSDTILKKGYNSSSQTSKSRFERWQDIRTLFSLNEELPRSCKHVLLIDDVITTGATIEACAHVLLQRYNISISVVCIALVT